MATRPQTDPVPDYTNAFLAMVWLIAVMGLVVVWGLWGYAAALGLLWLGWRGVRWAAARGEAGR